MTGIQSKVGSLSEWLLILVLLAGGVIGLFGPWWPGALFALIVAVVLLIRIGAHRGKNI
jgi:uncharacterized protein YqgC (DUF456 family)